MRSWRIPERAELLPVSPAQSCVVCGSGEWTWLYLLLKAPDRVQQNGWFANWFIAMCDRCQEAWEQGEDEALSGWWKANQFNGLGGPELPEFREVVLAMQSEPPLPRAAVTA